MEYRPPLPRPLFPSRLDHSINRLYQCLCPKHLGLPYLDPHSTRFCFYQRPWYLSELKRSLYGLKRSPRLFNETLLAALVRLGFVQSSFDPCLLFRKGLMMVIYVDDCGIGAANPNDIDKLFKDLQKLGFELTRERDQHGKTAGWFNWTYSKKFDWKVNQGYKIGRLQSRTRKRRTVLHATTGA